MSEKILRITEISVRGSTSLFFGGIFQTVVLAVGSIIVARMLGPSDYGLYAIALVVPTLLVSLTDLGLNHAMIYLLAKWREEGRTRSASRILEFGLAIRLLVGLASSLFIIMWADTLAVYLLNRPELANLVRIGFVIVIFEGVFNWAFAAFIGLDRMGMNAILGGVLSAVKVVASIGLILLGFGFAGAVVGVLFSFFVAGTAGVLLLLTEMRKTCTPSLGSTLGFKDSLRTMVGYGFPIHVGSVIDVAVGQLEFVLLAYFVSNLEIGNFHVASNFAVLFTTITVPITSAIFPMFSKFNPESEASDVAGVFAAATKYASLLVVPTAALVIVLSQKLVYAVYGPSYDLAPLFLSMATIYFLYSGIGSTILVGFLRGVGQTRLPLVIVVVNALAFGAAAPMLTYMYGIKGLIAASLISSFVSLLYGFLKARATYGVWVDGAAQARIYVSAGLSTLPVLLVVHFSGLSILMTLIVGGFVYLAAYLTMCPIIGAVRDQDIHTLRLIFRRIRFGWQLLSLPLAYEAKLCSIVSSLRPRRL